MPNDPRALRICQALEQHPDYRSTLVYWPKHLAVDVKTIQCQLLRRSAMTVGRRRQQTKLMRALGLIASGGEHH
jgi:hypothetical protein